ncbi:MAG: winged helix-turn-helix domain-containing protein [Victivallaceae bacterium]|nr:winged helix-turn-helix domain-containing protein [Victivallaceae bacterium]
MELLAVTSKKEQVAEFLRKLLVSGKIDPGCKLLSVRALAEKFSVSRMVIVDAMDILEAEHLIVREPGRGVFASKHNFKHTIDVYLLGYCIKTNRDVYFSRLSRIAHPPFLRDGFSFIVKTVAPAVQAPHQHFLHELKKIEQQSLDCLLISAAALNKKQILACTRMKIPVIFIGDFSSGLYPEMQYNQIAGDNSWLGAETARQLVEMENCHELTLYSGSMEHYFYRRYYDGVMNEAKRLGVDLHLVEMPKGITTSIPVAERAQIYLDKVTEAKANGWCNCPAIQTGSDSLSNNLLFKAFTSNNIRVPFYQSNECEKSFEQRFVEIYNRIETIIKNPQNYRKIHLKPKINVEEVPMEEIINNP